MKLKEYQKAAMQTRTESSNNFSYMMLNLVGEVGEFASKIAKGIRKQEISIDAEFIDFKNPDGYKLDQDLTDLKKELGDILWQLTGLIDVMGWDLEDIANMNLLKLAKRKEENKIIGNGDNR